MAGGDADNTGAARLIGVREAASHMVRANLGPGMLALPYAFGQAGWGAGTAVLALTIAQGMYSMRVLTACERQLVASNAAEAGQQQEGSALRRLSYGEVVEQSLGRRGRSVAEFFLFVAQAGVCCVYISLVTENCLALIPPEWRPSMALALCTLAPALFSWAALVRDVAQLRCVSVVGNAGMVAVVCAATASGLAALVGGTALGPAAGDAAWRGHVGPVTGTRDLVMLASSTFYAFEGMGLVLPIANSMAEPERFRESLCAASLMLVSHRTTRVFAVPAAAKLRFSATRACASCSSE